MHSVSASRSLYNLPLGKTVHVTTPKRFGEMTAAWSAQSLRKCVAPLSVAAAWMCLLSENRNEILIFALVEHEHLNVKCNTSVTNEM